MHTDTQGRRQPSSHDFPPLLSIRELEQVIAPHPESISNHNYYARDSLNRPLPPIPKTRRASSVYSFQHENDIIDYYATRESYREPSPDPILAPTSFSPSAISQFLRHQSDPEGSFAIPVISVVSEPNQEQNDFSSSSREKPEWTLQSPRAQKQSQRYQPFALSSPMSESPDSYQILSVADTASTMSSSRSVSPMTQSRPSRAYESELSLRTLSPKSRPPPTPRRKKHDPPIPINVRSHTSSVSPFSSPAYTDPSAVPYYDEYNFPNAPMSSRITQLVDHTLVPSPLRSSRVPSMIDNTSYTSLISSVSTISSRSISPASPTPRQPIVDWNPSRSPVRKASLPSPKFMHELQTPPQSTSRFRDDRSRESETDRILSNHSNRYPSTTPPRKKSSYGSRLASLVNSPRASIAHRLSDMYDTLTSMSSTPKASVTLTSVPRPSFAVSSKSSLLQNAGPSVFQTPKHKSTPTPNTHYPFPSPPLPSPPFSPRSHHTQSSELPPSPPIFPNPPRPAPRSGPRPIFRSPAIPITPYQHMGTKAWEEAPTPKKSKKKQHRSGEMGIFAAWFGRSVSKSKKKEEKEEEEGEEMARERWKEEMKKRIVVIGNDEGSRGRMI